jgi:hypothetical protein
LRLSGPAAEADLRFGHESGSPFEGMPRVIDQTHHRGQAHACPSILTGGESPSLDLLVFQRWGTAPNPGALSRQHVATSPFAVSPMFTTLVLKPLLI